MMHHDWVSNSSLAVWRSIARLARLEIPIWQQSGCVSVWQLSAGPVWQGEQSGQDNGSLVKRPTRQSECWFKHSCRLASIFQLPDCPICPIARLVSLPDLPDCPTCPIGPTASDARLSRLQGARLYQIGRLARLARLALPDCCPIAIRHPVSLLVFPYICFSPSTFSPYQTNTC